MTEIADQFFNFDIMRRAFPLVMRGLWMTLLLCATVIPLGVTAGLMLALLGRSWSALIRVAAHLYVDLFRALPPLVLLIFIYSGLPFLGIRLGPFIAVCVAFVANNAAYYSEIIRAGLESVQNGQWEAARSTGLSNLQAARYVVIPQALRNVLPDLISNTIEVVKGTSLASVVALTEVLHAADMARSITHNTSPIVLAAAVYLALLWPCVRLLSRLENKAA
jgi:polar amino acid transport system permease protein